MGYEEFILHLALSHFLKFQLYFYCNYSFGLCNLNAKLHLELYNLECLVKFKTYILRLLLVRRGRKKEEKKEKFNFLTCLWVQ